jgi:xylose isomerase
MSTGFFGDVTRIKYEGPESSNPLAFRHYDADEMVMGKRMEDHLRFAVAYWHSASPGKAATRLAGDLRQAVVPQTRWNWPS